MLISVTGGFELWLCYKQEQLPYCSAFGKTDPGYPITLWLFFNWHSFYLRLNSHYTLQGMELQEKETQKD